MTQPRMDAVFRRTGILVVDDDERIRRLCARCLRNDGFEAFEVGSGREALEVVARQSDLIDLVLTDIIMPDLNGVELVGRLRASHPRLRVVLMSGYAPVELLRRGVLASGLPLLRKPFTISELNQQIRAALSGTDPT